MTQIARWFLESLTLDMWTGKLHQLTYEGTISDAFEVLQNQHESRK